MSKLILFQMHQDDVCELTLNRPKKINTLNKELIDELNEYLKQLASQTSVRVLIISGSGKWFCGGADLNWMRDSNKLDDETNYNDAYQLVNLFHQLNNLPQVTIAKVTGGAFGGGIGLLCCCDLVIASENCVFSFGELKLGLLPVTILPYVIASIGERQARRFLLSGEQFTSAKAKEINLIHETASSNRLEQMVQHQVQHFLASGPNTLRTCKALLQQYSFTKNHYIKDTARILAESRTSAEAKEGVHSFLDKSKPFWMKSKE